MITEIETIEIIIRDINKTEDMIKTEEMTKTEEIKVDIKRTTTIKEDMMTMMMMNKMSTENIDTIRIIIGTEIEEITKKINTIIKTIRKDIIKNTDKIRKKDRTVTRVKKIRSKILF